MCALDLLRVPLARVVLFGIEIPCLRPPGSPPRSTWRCEAEAALCAEHYAAGRGLPAWCRRAAGGYWSPAKHLQGPHGQPCGRRAKAGLHGGGGAVPSTLPPLLG